MISKLPEGWKEVRLIDITEKIGSGSTPRGGAKVYIDEGISLIRSQNVLDFTFSTGGLVYIDEEAAGKLKNVEVFKNDILVNITGDSVARTCLVPDYILPARVNQHVSIIRTDEELAYYKYINYKLQDLKTLLLSYSSSGATRKALTKSMLENLKLNLPPLKEQQVIANTLSALDNKIELNNKINENLEEQAQTIFKHWFIDFEFPDKNANPYKSSGGEMIESELGMIPKGWEVGQLEDVVEFSQGIQVPVKNQSINKEKGYKRFIRIVDYTTNGSEPPRYIEDKDIRYHCSIDDIIMVRYGNIGLIGRRIEGIIANNLFKIEPTNLIGKNYLYYLLKMDSVQTYIRNSSTGSAMPAIKHSTIGKIGFVKPHNTIIDKFEKLTSTIEEIIIRSKLENDKLKDIRDTLLPKLMSGEIRIPLD